VRVRESVCVCVCVSGSVMSDSFLDSRIICCMLYAKWVCYVYVLEVLDV